LKKSIYGLTVAPRLWYLHLNKALESLKFKKSERDPCLMFRKDMILILFVDDLGIMFSSKKVLDESTTKLENIIFYNDKVTFSMQ